MNLIIKDGIIFESEKDLMRYENKEIFQFDSSDSNKLLNFKPKNLEKLSIVSCVIDPRDFNSKRR